MFNKWLPVQNFIGEIQKSRRPKSCQNPAEMSRNVGGQNPAEMSRNLGG